MFTIPERVDSSMTGTQFGLSIEHVRPGPAREQAIFAQLELGNIPDFMREPREFTVNDEDLQSGQSHQLVLSVMLDVLCIGTDDDFLRVPMTPATAQRVADLYGATLITPHLSDVLWTGADVQLEPHPMPPTAEMITTRWFIDHNAAIEKQRDGRRGLVRGHKKDIVIANSLARPEFAKKVGIYGWHQKNGKPIQGLNPSPGMPPMHTHDATYVDYSHGVHLISDIVHLDGESREFTELVLSEELAPLINGSGAGVLEFVRYPTS